MPKTSATYWPVGHGFFEDVVEHGVVAGVFFDEAAHGGDFVGVEDGAELAGVEGTGAEGGGHAHVFVAEEEGRVAALARRVGDARRASRPGQAMRQVLFVVPDAGCSYLARSMA